MASQLLREEKIVVIKALVEKIQKEYNCKVIFENKEDAALADRHSTLVTLEQMIKGVLKLANIKIVPKRVNENIELSGDLEFAQAIELSDKLRARGLLKCESIVSEGKIYLAFKTPDKNHAVIFQKPNK